MKFSILGWKTARNGPKKVGNGFSSNIFGGGLEMAQNGPRKVKNGLWRGDAEKDDFFSNLWGGDKLKRTKVECSVLDALTVLNFS